MDGLWKAVLELKNGRNHREQTLEYDWSLHQENGNMFLTGLKIPRQVTGVSVLLSSSDGWDHSSYLVLLLHCSFIYGHQIILF